MISRSVLLMNHFEVRFSQAGEGLHCEVTVPHQGTKSTSSVIGLGLKDFSRHASSPEHLFRRFLQIDTKTLRVAYTGGLKAGGSCCSSAIPAEIPLPKHTQQSENAQKTDDSAQNLEYEQAHAESVAKNVSSPMNFGTMEIGRLNNLKKICPYSCPLPQKIAKILLENCKDNEFWTSLLYLDDRSAISQILRRYLMAGIMKSPEAEDFDKNLIASVKKNLDEIRKRMELGMDYPELGTVIELTAVITLVSQRQSIASRWDLLIKSCPDISYAINFRETLPLPQ